MRNRKSNLLVLEHRLSQLERRIKNEEFDDDMDDVDDVDDIISGEVYALVITSNITDEDEYFICKSRATLMKLCNEIIERFNSGNGLDRLCRVNGIREFSSEYDKNHIMDAYDFCKSYGVDNDIFEDDDQLVYIDNIRDPRAWLVNIVKHIYEDF